MSQEGMSMPTSHSLNIYSFNILAEACPVFWERHSHNHYLLPDEIDLKPEGLYDFQYLFNSF